MTHWIEGLRLAREAECPWPGRKRVGKGAKAAGLRYEALLAAHLPMAKHGPWFEWWDSSSTGHGFCQPDLLLDNGDVLVVLECKYTWVPSALSQIRRLYKPVLEHVYARPVAGVVVCRTLTDFIPREQVVVAGLAHAIELAKVGGNPVLHWLGRSPLSYVPPARAAHHTPLAAHAVGL